VGFAYGNAAVWSASSLAYSNLHPAGIWVGSSLRGTNGQLQVGVTYNFNATVIHAGVWAGTAASYFDLHSVLDSSFRTSHTTAIDEQGNIVGYGDSSTLGIVALKWSPVPEPSSVTLLLVGLAWAIRRKRAG
jgi:hypothetical protein